MRPYMEAANFIGRQESIREDLARILKDVGEEIDPAFLSLPPINSSNVERIKRATCAPEALLHAVMDAERAFCETFEYTSIPEHLIAEQAPGVWPLLERNEQSEDKNIEMKIARGLVAVRFDYHWNSGHFDANIPGVRKIQWAALESLTTHFSENKNCAVITANEPYLAIYLSQSGKDVDLFTEKSTDDSQSLIDFFKNDINKRTFSDLCDPENFERYDGIALFQYAQDDRMFDAMLTSAWQCLRPGGTILIEVGTILNINFAIKMRLPHPKFDMVYRSLEYISDILKIDIKDIIITSKWIESCDDSCRDALEKISDSFNKSSQDFISHSIISIKKSNPVSEISPLDISYLSNNVIVESLPMSARIKISEFDRIMIENRTMRDRFFSTIGDRERDLASERKAHIATTIEAAKMTSLINELRRENEILLNNIRDLISQDHHRVHQALHDRENDLAEERKKTISLEIERNTLHSMLEILKDEIRTNDKKISNLLNTATIMNAIE